MLRHSFLHLTGEVGNNADNALDQHQLAAMMHLVLLYRDDQFKTALGRGRGALRERYELCQEIL